MNQLPVETPPPQTAERRPDAQLTRPVDRLSLVRESASAIIPYISYGAKRLGKTGIIGVSLLFFSAIAFVSGNLPLRQQLAAQAVELDSARTLAVDRRSGALADTPQQQAARFIESLPTEHDVPDIMTGIVTIAATAGIELERGSYELTPADSGAISRYQMSLPVTGSYPEVRKFVENVLATVPAITLENMRIERDVVSNRIIAADLKFSILLGGAR
ncbi:MAG: type 4a pilus biogenesis protein PilO [Gammaproteobacteria bacterium]|nr:type 4a pilus biogenesis protein PilO [Gammaproteobacteria bacterium]